jgi:hypothetical protein
VTTEEAMAELQGAFERCALDLIRLLAHAQAELPHAHVRLAKRQISRLAVLIGYLDEFRFGPENRPRAE